MKSAADVGVWCLVLGVGITGVWLTFATPHRPAAGMALVAAAITLQTTLAARRRGAGSAGRG